MSDQSAELKLYTSLRVDVTEAGMDDKPMEMPDPDFMSDAVRERFSTYHSAIQTALTAGPPAADLTSLFQTDFSTLEAFRDLTGKVSSLCGGGCGREIFRHRCLPPERRSGGYRASGIEGILPEPF